MGKVHNGDTFDPSDLLPPWMCFYVDEVFGHTQRERECCLLVLNLVSSTLPCIRRPRPRLRVLDVCGFV